LKTLEVEDVGHQLHCPKQVVVGRRDLQPGLANFHFQLDLLIPAMNCVYESTIDEVASVGLEKVITCQLLSQFL
jgi:hypothetical protein